MSDSTASPRIISPDVPIGPPGHRAWIGNRTIRTVDGGSGSMPFARCPCAWEGPSRLRRSAAIVDCIEHFTDVAPDYDPEPEEATS